ncbi:hypothetical protein ACQ4PT_058401 [Festuca glaucescens]
MAPARTVPSAALLFLLLLAATFAPAGGVEILSKSRLERCARDSGAGGSLACDRKIVLNLAVPSGYSGREASLVAQVVEVEENDTQATQTVRDPPVITINKSATYALYDISYIREAIVGPENRTVVSKDNFLRVNLIGDFVGYTSIPTFEDFYLVTPRKGVGDGQPQVLGDEFSRWMLLERVRFTLDGLECNKIGVGMQEFRPSSFGITELVNTNLLIELSADDIDYVYQRSPGKIISISVPTFEALSQVGTAQVTIKNIGKLEASYSLTVCIVMEITFFFASTFSYVFLHIAVLLWLLHQKGLFDPLYDWWEDVFRPPETAHLKRGRGHQGHHTHVHHHHHNRNPHAHKKHKSSVPGQHHHHHHVLHRHGGQPDAAAEGGERHRRSPALGVQHRDGAHKHHRHGKAVVQRERDGGGVEYKEQRGHRERQGGRERERHHSLAV